MSDEDWLKAAMTDDYAVAELLLHLHHATSPSKTASQPLSPPPPPPPLEWTVRQRRSKPMLHFKKNPTHRDSPTTPLSWSGATSVSGAGGSADADDFEDSSCPPPPPPDATRSKEIKMFFLGDGKFNQEKGFSAVGQVMTTNQVTTNKRTRRKKTLVELKQEEILLLKERRHLKRELATLHVNLEKQRATSESLKRLKLDLESQPAVERVAPVASVEATIPDQTLQIVSSCDPMAPIVPPEVKIDYHDTMEQPLTPKVSSQLKQEIVNQVSKFELPDLNLPLGEDSNSEVLHRVC